ncbi:MAG: hypothetical protein QXS68_06475 [Candidatus Methanomethylicaceae archaeon]
MRKVYLYGHLAEGIGEVHVLDVCSIGEAIRAIDANYPGFRSRIRRDGKYFVRVGEKFDTALELSQNELALEFKTGDFHVAPAIEGEGGSRGKAIGMVVLGIALIAVAFLAAPAAAAGAGVLGADLSAVAIEGLGITYGQIALFGVGMMFQGIVGLISPVPRISDYGAMERGARGAGSAKSYLFSGGTNLTQQGGPVPLVYGEVVTGSVVVSAGVRVEDLHPSKTDTGKEESSSGQGDSLFKIEAEVELTPRVL